MDEFPTDTARVGLARAISRDVMADATEFAELFDIYVDQLARLVALISPDWLRGIKVAQSVEARASEDVADRCRRYAARLGDMARRQTQAAQSDTPFYEIDLCVCRAVFWARGMICHALAAMQAIPFCPAPDDLGAYAKYANRFSLAQLIRDHREGHFSATQRC